MTQFVANHYLAHRFCYSLFTESQFAVITLQPWVRLTFDKPLDVFLAKWLLEWLSTYYTERGYLAASLTSVGIKCRVHGVPRDFP